MAGQNHKYREALAKPLYLGGDKIRRPKVEIRKKPESRNPNRNGTADRMAVRTSGFGFLSDFDLRISGFARASRVIPLPMILSGHDSVFNFDTT